MLGNAGPSSYIYMGMPARVGAEEEAATLPLTLR